MIRFLQTRQQNKIRVYKNTICNMKNSCKEHSFLPGPKFHGSVSFLISKIDCSEYISACTCVSVVFVKAFFSVPPAQVTTE